MDHFPGGDPPDLDVRHPSSSIPSFAASQEQELAGPLLLPNCRGELHKAVGGLRAQRSPETHRPARVVKGVLPGVNVVGMGADHNVPATQIVGLDRTRHTDEQHHVGLELVVRSGEF